MSLTLAHLTARPVLAALAGSGVLLHVAVELGREDGALAALAALREPAADDLLRRAASALAAVDVRGVEEVDAELVGAVHDRERVGLAGLRAEVHGAQDGAGDGQTGAAEIRVLHASS